MSMRHVPNARSSVLMCLVLAALCAYPAAACGGAAPVAGEAAKADKEGKLPHVTFDVNKKQVRVECEALAVDAPLEFFLCRAGTAEHESVLRSKALPSHVHTALLAIGQKPGAPVTFVEATEKWLPPHGPPLHLTVEYEKDGKTVSYPAYRLLHDIKTKKEPKAFTWVFTGSRVIKLDGDSRYGADDTGYMVTLVNFDFAMIDIPELASSSNEQLEWVRNAELAPPKGAKVTLIIEPAGAGATTRPAAGGATTKPAAGGARSAAGAAAAPEVRTDEEKVQALLRRHAQMIDPKAQALREAAQAHYEVIAALRAEQQRLISEADLLQRAIDELERKWSDMTVPRPAPADGDPAAPVPADTRRIPGRQ